MRAVAFSSVLFKSFFYIHPLKKQKLHPLRLIDEAVNLRVIDRVWSNLENELTSRSSGVKTFYVFGPHLYADTASFENSTILNRFATSNNDNKPQGC